ncbi:glucose-induced degradation protein 8 homolog isoform X2 [Cucurbita pepo subsp. pepo]|uniref:Glucose-induced degradation protein 8 homolog isoform X2 n=1 Tax=Cucurbita moschata TaxID=3662 RepID=A0A6J1FIX1_CUCMO|nr:glucose-induced degradation protein 8 homolog isoform X2 [Cucurbita moschata]XP_023525060.1 glucose-induced degradation protein 8 homolog isoform X2 [Cucurbita pepo subsp. pepo]
MFRTLFCRILFIIVIKKLQSRSLPLLGLNSRLIVLLAWRKENVGIYDFAVEGNALKAIELTEEVAHGLLEKNEGLHFDLLSLHFVELVCSRKCTEALEFAQVKLAPFGKLHKYVEKLEDSMALLAYEEPEKSPMFHLLSMDYRQRVAENLNREILAHANLPSYTAMERLIKQATVVRQSLSQELGKDGPSPFSLRDFLKS